MILLTLAPLAIAGFVAAGALKAQAGVVPPTTTSTITDCTRDHPCPNPGCTEAGHGPLDCKDVTTSEQTTEQTTTSECTRDHPCTNPGCSENHGPLDCTTTSETTIGETTTTTGKTTGHPKILKNWVGGDPPSGGAPFTIVCQDQSKDVSQTTPGKVQEYETVACMLNQLWTAIEHVPVGWQCLIGGNVTAISGHPDECEVTQLLGTVGEPPAVFTNQKVTTTTTESTPGTTTVSQPPAPTTTSTPPPAATTTSTTPAATTTAPVTTTSAPPAPTTTAAPTPPMPNTPVKHNAKPPVKHHHKSAVPKVSPPTVTLAHTT